MSIVDLDTTLDHHGGTLDDLLRAADTARVDKLAARFRKSAMKALPITAIEVIMAALQIMGETALEISPDPAQRRAVCAALVGHLVGAPKSRACNDQTPARSQASTNNNR